MGQYVRLRSDTGYRSYADTTAYRTNYLGKVSRYAKSNAYFTQVSRAGYAQRSRRSRRACRRRLARRRSSPMCFASTDTGARPCTGRAQFRTCAEAKRQQVAVCSNHLLRMEFR